jgi:acyl-CoA thioesterase-1
MKTPQIWLLFVLLAFSQPALSASESISILVLGDSLTAGYGLSAQDAFPAQLEQRLNEKGYPVLVINAGVSGDTSAGGAARLDWSLADYPDIVIVELGANDALRGLSPQQTRTNLATILARLREHNVRAILTGMKAPRNLGEDYYNSFDSLYPDLAAEFNVAFYPFFLEGVAGRSDLNQADGIHPTALGVRVIVDKMLPLVETMLARP